MKFLLQSNVRIELIAWRLLTWLLVLAGILVVGRADSGLLKHDKVEKGVHILSKFQNQLITSTTLKWVPGEYPQRTFSPDLVVGAVHYDQVESNEATQEKRKGHPVYVCRARHNGVWLVGSLTSGAGTGKCVVSLLGRVFQYGKYELLENVEQSSRISWVRWDRFSPPSTGAVSTGERDNYIARRRVDREPEPADADNSPALVPGPETPPVYLLGKLDTREGLGRIFFINQNGEEEHRVDGEILVEMEPVRYELTIGKFNQRRKQVSRQPRVLGTAQLTNELNEAPSKVDSVIGYDTDYSLYWGQIKGMLVGLPTNIILPNGTLLESINWGTQETQLRKELVRIEAILEPNTGVNVTLRGNFSDSVVPYTGELVAIYEDQVTRSRQIQGSRKEIAMLDVKAEYSPAYYLHNFTLVPTTTTTTTTTTTSAPTTTTTPAVTEFLEPTTRRPKKNETRRHENSAMLSDEGDALSLKKSEEEASQQSESNALSLSVSLQLSLMTLVLSSVISHLHW
ncbi:protein unzipped [Bemisia tabaci]|uniref:protein unzipped n=1 Tax=Bemisia tabaci TaxID=7038 RepID=UPI003B27C1AC